MCEDCKRPATYSLGCLDCCRRLYMSTMPVNRPAIVDMIMAYSPDHIQEKVRAGLGLK